MGKENELTSGEMAGKRMDVVAKKLRKQFGAKRLLDTVEVLKEASESIHGMTYGETKKLEMDWETLVVVRSINKLNNSLKKTTEKK